MYRFVRMIKGNKERNMFEFRNFGIRLIVALAMFQFVALTGYASHISGGSIKYAHVTTGLNQWYIEAGVFRDCGGASFNSTSLTITAFCNATLATTLLTLPHLPFVGPVPAPFGGPYAGVSVPTNLVAEEVSDVCDKVLNPNSTPNSNCRGGSVQGYTRFKYAGTFTLAPCNYWKLGFSPVCCRNTGSSNTSSGSMWVETWFDSQNFPTNTAPEFADEVKPIPSTCVGKTVFYGIGTLDPDGDSLRFELNCAMQSSGNCVTYNSGFSATQPSPGLKLDSTTGLISFTPQSVGKRVVAFWVKEYERCTGRWKAQTLRDVQFRVEQCSNNVPRDISGISNLQGKNAVKLGGYKLQVCNGTTVSWEDTIYDPDAADTLVFTSNYAQVMPGATMQTTFLARNKAVVKFTWYASIGISPVKIFYMVFNDDKCDYPGNGFSVFEIQVQNSTGAGPDILLCAGVDTAFIEGTGGSLYKWKTVWGDSLIWSGPNKNIWGDTTATDTNKRIKFFPSKTTYLEVTSDMKNGCLISYACQGKDSIRIVAAKDYKLIKSSDTVICFHDSVLQLSVVPDSAHFQYSYKWEANKTLSSDTVNNPIAIPIVTQKYKITVTSDSGCVKNDSINVVVTPPMPPVIKATTLSDPACPGVPAQIKLSLGRIPKNCGPTTAKCVGAIERSTSDSTNNYNGAGATGVGNWPCPYGASQRSARQQFLYTAAELSAMGVTRGTIEALGFNVVNTNGAGSMVDFTIRMTCMNPTSSTLNSWVLATTQVFNPKTISVSNGWNMHNFDQNYDYDGVSNLLVEICFTNLSSTPTNNASVAYTVTPVNSCLGVYGNIAQCSANSMSLIANRNRPNLRLSFCGARDSAEFKFKWTPAAGLNSRTAKDPWATIHGQMTYTVLLSDTFGKCSDSTSITMNVSNLDAGKDTSICPNDTILLTPKVKMSCNGRGKYKWAPSQYFPNDSLQNPLVSVPKTTVVTVTFSDSCGCVMKDSLTIFADSLKAPQAINKNPRCGFMDGSIDIVPVGGWSPYTYSIDSGKTYSGISKFVGLGPLYYNLRVTDKLGCVSPVAPDTLFNAGAPRIIGFSTTDISCKSFADGTISITTSGGVQPLSFSVDSGATWGASNVIGGLRAGKYIMYARGAGLCTSFPETVFLTEPDTFTLDFEINTDSCFNQGNGWAEARLNGGVKPYTTTWLGVKPGASKNPVVVGDSIYKNLYAFNNYIYKAVDSNGCIIDSTFTVGETPNIVIDSLTSIPSTCFGYDNAEISIHAVGGNPALGKGSYFFSLDSGKNYYPPTFGGNPNFATLDTSVVKHGIGAKAHNIFVRDESGCIGTSIIVPTQPDLMVLTTPQDSIKICVSTCTRMQVFSVGGNNTDHKYHWTPSIGTSNVVNVCPEKNSIYSVYATDNKGCASNSQLMRVYLYDSLKVFTSPDTSICAGSVASLRSYPSGGDGYGYNFKWSPFSNLSNAFISNPFATPRSRAVYKVTIGDECGSPEASDTVVVEILPQPEVNFVGDTLAGCPPLISKFQNLTNASAKCRWEFGDGSRTQTCQDVYKTYTQAGKYDVTLVVESVDGCKDSLKKENYVDIYRVPRAGFSMSPQPTDILNTNIHFEDESEGRIIEWNWNFASMDTSLERNPTFRFPDEAAGKYPVRLDVYSDLGCKDDTIRYVVINAKYFLYIPSSFTPNGDGKNDTWKPLGTGFEPDFFHVTVFDRWGRLVYESIDYNDAWDGVVSTSGEKAPVGVYSYKIVAGDANNEKERHELFGTITIVK
ncbi:MAG: gliding motility-associated C-terminal domain-containing protein [Flavobacteriales bacterium]|nr:gliding motility-associated C-terminal domain-containing protein [Flavobacteriales bacterium]